MGVADFTSTKARPGHLLCWKGASEVPAGCCVPEEGWEACQVSCGKKPFQELSEEVTSLPSCVLLTQEGKRLPLCQGSGPHGTGLAGPAGAYFSWGKGSSRSLHIWLTLSYFLWPQNPKPYLHIYELTHQMGP